jgi:hypothetical protein
MSNKLLGNIFADVTQCSLFSLYEWFNLGDSTLPMKLVRGANLANLATRLCYYISNLIMSNLVTLLHLVIWS